MKRWSLLLALVGVFPLFALPLFASEPSLQLSDWICESCGAMADIDGDGLDDMFAVKDRRMFRNLGGSFSAAMPITGIADNEHVRSIGDYDGDGFADLVLWPDRGPHDEGPNRFAWGDGRGRFTGAGPAFPKQYGDLGQTPPRDFNADGKLDLVLMKSTITGKQVILTTLSFLAGKGDGTFELDEAISFRGGVYPYMAIADFDRDGHWDLIRTGDNPDSLYFHYSNGNGRLGPGRERYAGAYINRVQGADVNGDGFADLVLETWDQYASAMVLLYGDAHGRFTAYTEMPAMNSGWGVILGNFFPGGGDELAITHGDGYVTIYTAVENELNVAARMRIPGSSHYQAGLVRYRSSTQTDFQISVRDFSRGVDRGRILFLEGELPHVERTRVAGPRRARAMRRAAPAVDQYAALVSGTCVPPALDAWSFTREGIFLDFEPNESGTEIRGALVAGKLSTKVTSGDRILGGKLSLTPDRLEGYLYNRSDNPCGGRVRVDGMRIR